jgi:hypothetical protein
VGVAQCQGGSGGLGEVTDRTYRTNRTYMKGVKVGAAEAGGTTGLAYRTKVPLSGSESVVYFCWLCARDLT